MAHQFVATGFVHELLLAVNAGDRLAVSARFVVGFVLLFAAVMKLTSRHDFAKLVGAFGLVPSSWSTSIAIGLPWAEAVVGSLLVLGVVPVLAGGAAVLMLVVFTLAVALNLARGRFELSCGCFGGRATIGWHLVLRNIAFVFITIAAMAPSKSHVMWLVAILAGALSWRMRPLHRATPPEDAVVSSRIGGTGD